MSDSESDSGDETTSFKGSTFSSRGRKTSYPCPYGECPKFFSRPSRLKAHMRIHTGERPFKCVNEGCGMSYSRKSHLVRHVQNNHEKSKGNTEEGENFKCEICNKKYQNKYSLKKHLRTSHEAEKRRVKCEKCGETFSKKAFLPKHDALMHGVFLKCTHKGCEKTFLTAFQLARHGKKHVEKEYSCSQCAGKFGKWTLLRKHVAVAHKKRQSEICGECGKKVSDKNYKKHLETHKEKREFYHCPYTDCEEIYNKNGNLECHIRTVHKGHRFACLFEGCQAQMSSRRKHAAHMKTFHSGQKNTQKPPKTLSSGRALRKDKGQAKKSMVSELTGLDLGLECDKKIIGNKMEAKLDPTEILEEAKTTILEVETDEEPMEEEEEEETVKFQPLNFELGRPGVKCGATFLRGILARDRTREKEPEIKPKVVQETKEVTAEEEEPKKGSRSSNFLKYLIKS